MSEQRTPDELAIENALICEKLLGFKRHCDKPGCLDWRIASGQRYWGNPTFTTWADAGLVLEAWTAANNDYDIEGTSTEHGLKISARLRQIKGISYVGDFVGYGETAPLAVRAAAIKYIRSLP
jgi:hypothetical protein